jgi:ACS family sodium-dependent inorganic phosphate cotransporter
LIIIDSFQSAESWKIVFYISAGIYLVGCVIYWFYASGEVQPWARNDFRKNVRADVEKNGKAKGHAYTNEGVELKDE